MKYQSSSTNMWIRNTAGMSGREFPVISVTMQVPGKHCGLTRCTNTTVGLLCVQEVVTHFK